MALQIPTLRQPGKGTFGTSPEAVRQWIEELPLANTDATTRLLDKALSKINGIDIPPSDRLEILNLLTGPVTCTVDQLKNGILAKPLPLKGKDLEKAHWAMGLCLQLATGYKILVVELDKEANDISMQAVAVYRALRFLGEALLSNYQIYIQYPEDIWKDIHQLYAMAELRGFSASMIDNSTQAEHPAQNTIETVYKQILLLSLSCPYRMHRNEIGPVYDMLARWAPYSILSTANDSQDDALFVCRLDSDEPPSYLADKDNDLTDGQIRLLSTAGMEKHIPAHLPDQEDSSAHRTKPLDDRILQRLLLSWGVRPQRRFTRHQQDASIHLAIGLNTIHGLLSDTGEPQEVKPEIIGDNQYLQDPTFEQPTSFRTDRRRNDPTSLPSGPIRGMGRRAEDWQTGTSEKVGPGADPSPRILHTESWKILNISAGGFCLWRDGEEASRAQVGELVAMNSQIEGDGDGWQLGVIRWMKSAQENSLELGIQTLSPGAIPVWASIFSKKGIMASKFRGILLPEVKAIGQQSTLLLPTPPFHTGSLSTIENAGKKEKFSLIRQVENTGCFSQFHFLPDKGQ